MRKNPDVIYKSLHISSFVFVFALVFCNSTPLLDNGGFERLTNARPTAKANQTLASKLAWLYVFDRHRVWITPSVYSIILAIIIIFYVHIFIFTF